MEERKATFCEREHFLYWRRPGKPVHPGEGGNMEFCDECVPVKIVEDLPLQRVQRERAPKAWRETCAYDGCTVQRGTVHEYIEHYKTHMKPPLARFSGDAIGAEVYRRAQDG